MDEPITPVFCIHGYTGSWRNWTAVGARLAEQHSVHVARLAGHADGRPLPENARPTVAALADRLEKDLDAAGIEQAHLVGNSIGGWLALELAARGRALSVTALAPLLGWEPTGPHLRALSRKFTVGRWMSRLGAPFTPLGFHSGLVRKAALGLAIAHADRMSREQALDFIRDMAGCSIMVPLQRSFLFTRHDLGPLDCPAQIVLSGADQVVPLDPYGARWSELVPHARFLTLPDVGHVPMYDDPELVAGTILTFTRSIDASSAPGSAGS